MHPCRNRGGASEGVCVCSRFVRGGWDLLVDLFVLLVGGARSPNLDTLGQILVTDDRNQHDSVLCSLG